MKRKSYGDTKGFSFNLPLSKKEMMKYYGERCPSFEESCPSCEAWKQWDTDKTVPIWVSKQNLFVNLFME